MKPLDHTNEEKIFQGQHVYNPLVLILYDWWVLGFSNHLLWNCPTKFLRQQFKENISTKHLDIGVGSGYFLKHCIENPETKITLLDLNQNSLNHAAKRARPLKTTCIKADAFNPLPILNTTTFDSVSLCYLFHCLPGNILQKSIIIENLKPNLSPNVTVFGSTIIEKKAKMNWGAKRLMKIYQKKGIFHNQEDTTEDLEKMLQNHFKNYSIEQKGLVTLFKGSKKKK